MMARSRSGKLLVDRRETRCIETKASRVIDNLPVKRQSRSANEKGHGVEGEVKRADDQQDVPEAFTQGPINACHARKDRNGWGIACNQLFRSELKISQFRKECASNELMP